ncbi:NAD-dependent epimerase/dehydratase family protein [bacterium]|nr:NAD-dependent epimerase/dehydratase family protein [bacterium]
MEKTTNFLITGGLGFFGQHLCRKLRKEYPRSKIKIIDLKLNSYPIYDYDELKLEVVLNKDITELETIEDEFKGIDVVFHLAGAVFFSIRHKEMLEKVNVLGTKNVLKAAIKNKVKRFIHVNSVAGIGFNNNPQKPVNEEFKFDWESVPIKYYMLSKYYSTREVFKCCDKMDCIVVSPALLWGPGDYQNTYKIIKAIADGKLPVNMPGGTYVADVRDIAEGIIAAYRNGKNKENYILGGHNLSFQQINRTVAGVLNTKALSITIPKVLHKPFYYASLALEKFSKKPLLLTADNIDSAFMYRYFDNSKANCNLGWNQQFDFRTTICDSVVWLKQKELV